MGYLTTITFRNDAFHELAKDPKAVIEKIQAAMSGNLVDDNQMISQMPVHSHDSAVYVCAGNTTVEVTSPSKMKELMRNNGSFFDKLYAILGQCLGDINEQWTKVKKEKKA